MIDLLIDLLIDNHLHRVLEIGPLTESEPMELDEVLPAIVQFKDLELLSLFNFVPGKNINITLMTNLQNLRLINIWQCHPEIENVIRSGLTHVKLSFSPDSLLSGMIELFPNASV